MRQRRAEQELGFLPEETNVLLLSHPPIDHTGLIPKLAKEGLAGTIISTKATFTEPVSGILTGTPKCCSYNVKIKYITDKENRMKNVQQMVQIKIPIIIYANSSLFLITPLSSNPFKTMEEESFRISSKSAGLCISVPIKS